MDRSGHTSKTAFTLMELLVVIAVIAILAGIAIPTFFNVRDKAKTVEAKATAKYLETAFNAYLDHYRVWPAAALGAAVEPSSQAVANAFVQVLRGDTGADNPEGMPFFEFKNISYPSDPPPADTACDPWHKETGDWKPYWVAFDLNYDNQILVNGTVIYRRVGVWSAGPDRTNGTPDDVKSWE